MDDKVLQALITLYKSKGVPLDKIVNSELFKHLPVDKKIAIIKAVGDQSKSKMHVDSTDVKNILLGLGLGTLAAVYAFNTTGAYSAAVKNAISSGLPASSVQLPSFALLSGIGATAGYAGSNLVDVYKNIRNKYELKKVNTNSDNAILSYLSERDRYASS